MANTFNKSISEYKESLAKDLGYNSYKEYLQANKKDYSGNIKQRLEQGAGFKEAFSGSMGESYQGLKKKVSPKNIAKTFYMNFFKGDDIFSAYMRGRLNKKKSTEPTKPIEKVNPSAPKMEFMESFDKKLVGRDEKGKFTKLTDTPVGAGASEGAGDFAGLSGIVKDVIIIRNAVSQLLNFEKESKEQGDRAEQIRFLQEQDAREASLENSPTQISADVETTGGGETKKDGKGIIGMIMGFVPTLLGLLKTGLIKAFKLLFKPSNLLKFLAKAFLIGTIIVSLFKGITAGFDRWKETGSISEAIIAGLGAIVDFISFGLFGEEQIRKIFDSVADFITPIKDWVVDAFYGIKDWIVNNIGIPKIVIPIPKWVRSLGAPENVTVGPWYPFKSNSTSSEPEFSERPTPEPQELKEVKKISEKSTDTTSNVSNKIDLTTETQDMLRKVSDTTSDSVSPINMGMAEKGGGIQDKISGMMSGDGFGTMMGGLTGMVSKAGVDTSPESQFSKEVGGAMGMMSDGTVSDAFGKLGEGSANIGGSLEGAQSNITEKIKAGGVTPEPVTPFGAATSGEKISKGSSEVESGQRAEMTQDSGSMINAPQIRNQASNSSKSPPPADVLNFEFANAILGS